MTDKKISEQFLLETKDGNRLLNVVKKAEFEELADEVMVSLYDLNDLPAEEQKEIYDKMKKVTQMCYYTRANIHDRMINCLKYASTYLGGHSAHVELTEENKKKLGFKTCLHKL